MGYINSLLAISIWIGLILLAAISCRRHWPQQQELSRKIIHIGTGPLIPLAWWLKIPSNLAIPIAVVITFALLINHRWRWLPAIEDISRYSYGTVAYGLSISILLAFLWRSNQAAVCAGVLVMAFGDGLAGLIGRQMKSPSWTILGQRKSVAGTLTMAITGVVVLGGLSLWSGTPIYPLGIVTIAILATGLEQISCWGLDNLTVPIGVGFAWSWMAGI